MPLLSDSATFLHTQQDSSQMLVQMRDFQQRISSMQEQLKNVQTAIKQSHVQISHLQKLITYIHLQSQQYPLQSFKSYCQSMGVNVNIMKNGNKYVENEFRTVNLFQLSEEDCVIVNGSLTAWQKVGLVERRIVERQDEIDFLERDRCKLDNNIQQCTQQYNQLLANYQAVFQVTVKKFR